MTDLCFYVASISSQVRGALIMAISDQKTTSQQSVKLISGSLYQVTQVINEVSLEAQVDNNQNSAIPTYGFSVYLFKKNPFRFIL